MGHSIYLADDEKSIRELLHSFLASDGYTVRSFESGDALLEAFRQEPAELVILDIMMPGTDGLAVCRELRSVSDIPIILLTAKDSELDYVMGISQGSDDYLTKPFRPTILLMKVKALLRRVEMDRGKTAAAEDEPAGPPDAAPARIRLQAPPAFPEAPRPTESRRRVLRIKETAALSTTSARRHRAKTGTLHSFGKRRGAQRSQVQPFSRSRALIWSLSLYMAESSRFCVSESSRS